MLYHLVSTDPDNYGTIKFRSSIQSMNSVVMYRISSLSTIASFSMTTPNDYLIIETTITRSILSDDENETGGVEEVEITEPIELRLNFTEHGAYDLRTLTYELNSLFEGQLVSVDESLPIELSVTMDSTNRLIMTANKEFNIKEASHNVKLLLGCYHSTLPISSRTKTIRMPSVPYISFGNVLYLTARTDFVSVVNTDEKEITRSIAYKTNEILYPGYPISCRLPGSWSMIHSDQLSSLEFQLVDFQLEPVVLHAPLYVTLEIQRLDNITQAEQMSLMEVI